MGRTKDYDYYGMLPESEILRSKEPNVFVYQQITDECGIYEVRVGCGWDGSNLPPFKIPFRIPDGDFILVKHARPAKKTKLSPHSGKPDKGESIQESKQEEMAL